MRIDDYCCLGRTVPEESKRYGRKVCSAGYSEELGSLMRVYPLPVITGIHQRSVCTLELQRNKQDSRRESWRLAREEEGQGIVRIATQRPIEQVIAWLGGESAQSIRQLNGERRSLGVIRPGAFECYFRERGGKSVDPDQKLLFDDLDEQFGAGAVSLAPYLRFRDEDGWHDLQVREWGCYEWLRKEPGKASQLWDNLRLRADRDVFLLVGNMCNRRNVWLVISVFSRARTRTLFDEVTDGPA